MADNSASLCTATVNGTTITCACSGCGIAYNHATKTYHILCCGSITEMKALNQADDPKNPPKRGQIMVDLSNVTLLEAAQLLERSVPGKIAINSSLKKLRKQITLKANLPLAKLTKRLGLKSASK
jgi:hypothetical protein